MRWKRRAGALVFLALPGFVACGGIAIIDEAGSGGAAASNSSTGSGVLCTTIEPVGNLSNCGTTGVTSGGAAQCSTTVCDSDGNRWESECEGNTCICKFNSVARCTCFVDGTLCTGTVPSCCPEPFPS